MPNTHPFRRTALFASAKAILATTLLSGAAIVLTGCSGFQASTGPQVAQPLAGVALGGDVHGGQQPIVGAQMLLFAAGTGGYASANTNLLTTTVLTGARGGFNITGDYTCTAGQQMYLVAQGGNPGAGTNANSALMAALGDCAGLSASTRIQMNEITTIGSVFALAPFMSGYAALGTSSGNTAGLRQAFASVNKLTYIAGGVSPGPALPAGAKVPVLTIYTLADVIAGCINSTGGAAGSNTTCGSLFSLTTVGGVAPTDTIGAAVAMAQNPTLNVASLFTMATPNSPYPHLPSPPNDWTLSVVYAPAGLSSPQSTTIDATGNVWIANSGNNTVTVLAQTGAPATSLPLTLNGLNAPVAIAIDASGNAWVANLGGATISAFTASGGVVSGSPFSGNGLAAPAALAFDAPGNLWVANSGANTVSEFSATGGALQQLTGLNAPAAITIDPR